GQRISAIIVKIQDEESGGRLPGDDAKGGEIDPSQGIGVARVPARNLHVVVERVRGVPAEDHITEAKSGLGSGIKLLAADVFPAQHAVDVESADSDFGDAVFVVERFD